MHAATSERCSGAEFCSAAFHGKGRGILGDFLRGMAEQDNRPVFDKPGADAGRLLVGGLTRPPTGMR
ncbi:hypothetical protein NKI38_08775 [Mesorhizobium sp. M0621]|uniref:hypothetical protein n=1 Tax=Mesorhizobium sp. M0621 TaxID=2956974 RepID=UPI003339EE6E